LDVELADKPIPVPPINIAEDPQVKKLIEDFLFSIKTPFLRGAINYGKRYFTRIIRDLAQQKL
jgi:hypothetical protein